MVDYKACILVNYLAYVYTKSFHDLIIEIMVFWALTLYSFIGGYRYLVEYPASIFRAEMCRFRNYLVNIGKLYERWSCDPRMGVKKVTNC